MQVMSQVESEKKALGPIEDAQMQVELMAMKVFDKGDKQYREGKAITSLTIFISPNHLSVLLEYIASCCLFHCCFYSTHCFLAPSQYYLSSFRQG